MCDFLSFLRQFHDLPAYVGGLVKEGINTLLHRLAQCSRRLGLRLRCRFAPFKRFNLRLERTKNIWYAPPASGSICVSVVCKSERLSRGVLIQRDEEGRNSGPSSRSDHSQCFRGINSARCLLEQTGQDWNGLFCIWSDRTKSQDCKVLYPRVHVVQDRKQIWNRVGTSPHKRPRRFVDIRSLTDLRNNVHSQLPSEGCLAFCLFFLCLFHSGSFLCLLFLTLSRRLGQCAGSDWNPKSWQEPGA